METITARQAMQLIVQYQNMPALNYAVNYAKQGLSMAEGTDEFRVQCLYLQNNLSTWRATKTSTVTKEQIQAARAALKKAGGLS